MRKSISILLAIGLILGAFLVINLLMKPNKSPKPIAKPIVKSVNVFNAENTLVPIAINASGTLQAKQKIVLFSEVQGVLSDNDKAFKSGNTFEKGAVLMRVNSDEHQASLRALKSNFYSQLTAIMPDIQLDFVEDYPKWHAYLKQIDIQKPLPELPSMSSDKEKYFITGRNILNTYYQVKNAEVRLSKYTIRAPFSGTLSESNVNPGALISPGQKLGVFINTKQYELEIKVNVFYADMLQKGKSVRIYNLEHTKEWTGIVNRINPTVDTQSQSVSIYIDIKDAQLKEGMYLEVLLSGKPIENVIEINRNLMVGNQLYVVQDSVLKLQPVQTVFANGDKIVVKGLENGQLVLKEPLLGAYEGIKVKVNN